MFGLGKKRSKFGRFIDSRGISQEELRKVTGLNKDTLTKVCSDDDVNLRDITKDTLVRALRKLTGKTDLEKSDFWTVAP
ncbi:hypothetical protein GCM10010916_02450 [Paenibacillus abyssi]|uniref:Uncharacterized protein n=1 Tax=Paenibacillus abyssi TaxID=1340531 RepID=A0A917FM12_9BACL|nr:hypothetical protein GCM10010916_02450 [Paenibacillus abyssi]